MKSGIASIAAIALLLGAGPAAAEVKLAEGGVMRLENKVVVKATPEQVYTALGEIGRWWNGAHSYSRNAANMTIELKPGGCFCEALPGGGVKHGEVSIAWPGLMVRILAALGPLQDEGVTGALTFTLKKVEGGTEIVQTYNIGGLRPQLLQAAPGIDAVVREQLGRLATYVETGKPER